MPFKDYQKALEYNRERYHKMGGHTPANRLRQIKNRYGPEATAEMLGAEGKCPICLRTRKLVIDHDHETGVVRGLICRTCNTGIGHLMDNPELLLRALDYLRR